ncbi:MAG: hypothetical protein M3P27_00915 [Acidobacteriota bacterium]|nr:hypothetical protein [Acidobacteriota bacterium]
MPPPKLKLDLLDVYGKRLKEKVDIRADHFTLNETKIYRGVDASKQLGLTDLRGAPQGMYRLEIDPPSYVPVSVFANLKASGDTPMEIRFPIDIRKIREVEFPIYSSLPSTVQALLENSKQMLGFPTNGKELYEALDNIRKAGLLNLVTKAAQTRLTGDTNVLSMLHEIRELRGDRFFVRVPHELREEVKNTALKGRFHEAPQKMHHPPSGYQLAGSYKTSDHYGNLQITFFASCNAPTEWLADIDIDDAGGFEHMFQVIRNQLTGEPTHPYNIHEIIVYHQKLDPGYYFVL